MNRPIIIVALFALGVPWGAHAESILDNLRAKMPSALEGLEMTPEESAFPLHFMLRKKRYNVALELIPLSTNIDARDSNGETALTIGARDKSADAYDMMSALLSMGADPNLPNAEGLTALHYAARAGTLAVVELLVDRFGADVNAGKTPLEGDPDENETPLVWSAIVGNLRVVAFLERRGAKAPKTAKLRMKIQIAQAVHYERLIDSRIHPSMDPYERARAKTVCRAEARALAFADVGAPVAAVKEQLRKHRIMAELSADPSKQDASPLDILLEATQTAMETRSLGTKSVEAIREFNRQVRGR